MNPLKFNPEKVALLSEGKVNVQWDKTLPVEQLQALLKEAFPNDSGTPSGDRSHYGQYKGGKNCWISADDATVHHIGLFVSKAVAPFSDFIEVEEKHPEFTPNGMLPMGGFEMRFMPSDAMDKGRAIVLVHPDDFETVKNHFDQRFKTS